ncbi:MAG: LacI family transcriptional regulator [Actinobacteria bacterium]|nr:LacI family transcriptional regulator [Actinomycetota bacterium]MCG2803663.1 LacI family transcriptional regulator [Cellulomonas sp.]
MNAAKAPTVYDVASLAGVSIATVSRVFRRPQEVTAATQETVQRAVRELGYVPSGSARGLAARRSGAIGLCFPDFDGMDEIEPLRFSDEPIVVRQDPAHPLEPSADRYIAEVMRGVQLEAWRHATAVTVAIANGRRGAQVFDDLAGRVDGLVTLSATIPDDQLMHFARRLPVVVVAGPRAGDDYGHVTTDNAGGMQALTEHLLTVHQVRDLAYVAGPAASPDDRARFSGFRAALRAAGLMPPRGPTARGAFTRTGGRDVARALLAAGTLPRAVVCGNDQMALGLLDVLPDAGVRVPEDVIVTGFDGIEPGDLSRPRLTTVRQPMLDLGRAAVELVRRRMADPEHPPEARVLAVEVLLRESCGCGH